MDILVVKNPSAASAIQCHQQINHLHGPSPMSSHPFSAEAAEILRINFPTCIKSSD